MSEAECFSSQPYTSVNQENGCCPSLKIENPPKEETEDLMNERRPSEPKYCAMNSVIISPAPSRQSSVRNISPRMRAETLAVPNTWIGKEPDHHRVRKISHPSYTFFGEERTYDFPGESRSGLLYAEDDYRMAANQVQETNFPCLEKHPEPSPDKSFNMEESNSVQDRNDMTQVYHRLVMFVAVILLFILLVTGWSFL